MDNNTSQNKTKHTESGIGPIVGTLIIVILLIITALYIWGEHLNNTAQMRQADQNLGTTTITIYSTSTEPVEIQKDLKATPLIQNPSF